MTVDEAMAPTADAIRREGLEKAAKEREGNRWLRQLAHEQRPQWFQRGDNREAAEFLRNVLSHEKLLHDLGEIYRYRTTGLWEPIPIAIQLAIFSDLAGVLIPGARTDKPLHASQRFTVDCAQMFANLIKASHIEHPYPFEHAPMGLGFENGFLTIVGGQPVLLPHSPNNLCRFAYDFAYAPDAEHPMLDQFFATCFRGESPENQAKLPMVLQEFLGACLFGRATLYEKVLILTGLGGNGKSQFLEIARNLFPPGSLAALPPQKWGDAFGIGDLAGKLANFVDEIPEREISSGAVFKAIVSGQPTHANRKYRDAVTFKPIAGHIWSANSLFDTTDTSDGFYRRFLVIPFDSKPRPDEIIPAIGQKIVTKEKRAIVSWAIQGYCRMLQQGERYTEVPRISARTEAWRSESDRVRLFLLALYERHFQVEYFSTTNVFSLYGKWCETQGYKPCANATFLRRVRQTQFLHDKHGRSGRGFVWNHELLREVIDRMGTSAPDWGVAPEPPPGTYSPFSGM